MGSNNGMGPMNMERTVRYTAPEICPVCKMSTEEKADQHGGAWIVYVIPSMPPVQVFQCTECHVMVGTVHAMENARKIKAAEASRIIKPNFQG